MAKSKNHTAPQPILQGSQEWHQETQEAPPHFHQRDGSQVLEELEVCKEAQQEER
ncbi:hypothetical protein Gotur_021433 [Gossypium turneri]